MARTSSLKSRIAGIGPAALCIFSVSASASADPSGQAHGIQSNVAVSTLKGSCVAEKEAFASSANVQSTTSDTMVNVAGAIIKPTITQGCLVVDFSTGSYAASTFMYVRVLLDGTPMTPGLIQFSAHDAASAAHAFSFVATGLSSGQHTVQVQFQNTDNSTAVYISDYTLVAHYD